MALDVISDYRATTSRTFPDIQMQCKAAYRTDFCPVSHSVIIGPVQPCLAIASHIQNAKRVL